MGAPCSLKFCGDKKYYCSVELTLQVIGGKWKPIIMHRLGSEGTLRFSEVKRSIPNITQKMLTQQLRELESDGVVLREVYPQVPPKVEYSLTDLGRSVMPVIASLSEWGTRYAQWYAESQPDAEAV
ncbi:MAG: winged helix-turn-helix transcriptional regulator [Pseudodesulfovibrio sp.]|jgi:DNA-binding HxlR family transcriptional regulator|uniref:HxlR family transcriptional regulator n=1 Tax=Pseudodesulfovibrio indicus TaxID=1716143 RepID=A0A140D9J6_9BACT|nr:helix-turn-helix domain-containing protein [Pseudodesulfovibrio indicus]AMK09863.1 HxlR family transcriptional regulator [Pseudodesulfovibrio indicus]TDT87459.1 HxlR family transcriptional regulator [Pseudodesulfovibrio indicus]